MSEKWIEHNLKPIVSDKEKRYEILKNYSIFLTGVSKYGKKIEVFELSKGLTKIKKRN